MGSNRTKGKIMSHVLIKASLAAPALSSEVLMRPPAVVERSADRLKQLEDAANGLGDETNE